MAKSARSGRRAAAAALLALCALAALYDSPSSPSPMAWPSSRALSAAGADAVFPWADTLLAPLARTPDPARETPLFWHVPKSGGSTVKSLYRCMRMKLSIQSRKSDIASKKSNATNEIRAGRIDLVVSTRPAFAVEVLFAPARPARALAVFRHPVERLISKFYYLQTATWERTYRPEWQGMDLLDWARHHNGDNNALVKALARKVPRLKVTEKDLRLAKETLRSRFVVGLTEQMEESARRFNVVMGIDDATAGRKHAMCMRAHFGKHEKKVNANAHPEVDRDSAAWRLLAKQNAYDLELYEFVRVLFKEQRAQIDAYGSSPVASATSTVPEPVAAAPEPVVAAPAPA